MSAAVVDHAALAPWMRYRDYRVNNLLQIADYLDTIILDEDVAAMRREVRELTYVIDQESLGDAAIDRLLADMRDRIDRAQRLEDNGDADGDGWHDIDAGIEQLRDEAATIAEHVLTIKGHRRYALVAA